MTRWHQERAVYYFAKVAEARSFTLAARQLNMAQPNMSAIIARLEAELGHQLIDRPGVPLTLTPEGERLLLAATPMVAAIDRVSDLLSQLRAEQQMTVRIGGNSATGDVPERQTLIEGFQAANSTVRLRNFEFPYGGELDTLRSESADFLFSFEIPPPPYEYLTLARCNMVFLVPDEHPLSRHAEIPIDWFAGCSVLDWTRSAESPVAGEDKQTRAPLAWVMAPLLRVGATLIASPEFNSRANLRYASRMRLILPLFEYFLHLPEIPEDMRLVRVQGPQVSSGFYLVSRKPPQWPAARAFWHFAEENALHTEEISLLPQSN